MPIHAIGDNRLKRYKNLSVLFSDGRPYPSMVVFDEIMYDVCPFC